MADLQQTFNHLCPAGTAASAPQIDNAIQAGPYRVTQVQIVIPIGHAGLTGVQLWYGGGAMIPYESEWISTDNETYTVNLSKRYPAGASWQVASINADVYDHVFQTRWEMDFVTARQARRYVRLGVGDVYAAADIAA